MVRQMRNSLLCSQRTPFLIFIIAIRTALSFLCVLEADIPVELGICFLNRFSIFFSHDDLKNLSFVTHFHDMFFK